MNYKKRRDEVLSKMEKNSVRILSCCIFLFFLMTAMVSTSMLTTCMSFPMVVLMERILRINLKCLCVSKVLENLSIFICYCYSHDTFLFFYCIFWVNLLFVTPSKAAVAALTVTDYGFCTLLLTVTFLVQKTDCLVLIYRQNNGRFFLSIICRKNNGRFFLSIICRKKF